jgi:hypothetical protein
MKHDTTGEIIDPDLDLSSQTSKAAIPEVDIDVRWSGSLADENSTVGGLRPVLTLAPARYCAQHRSPPGSLILMFLLSSRPL